MPPSAYDLSFAVRPQGEGMDRRLYAYQQAADEQVLYGWRKHAVMAHHPGAGKTPMALLLAQTHLALGGRVEVVCPPSLCDQWAARAKTWIGEEPVVCWTGARVATCGFLSGMVIIPDSLLYRVLHSSRPGTLVIIDEFHRFKERGSRRTRALFGGKHGETRYPGLTQHADRIVALSGTPVIASPVDMFPLLKAMRFPEAATFKAYTERYCPPYQAEIRVGRTVRVETRYDQPTNAPELARRMREFCVIRPNRADYMGQLPKLTEDHFHVDIIDPAEQAGVNEADLDATPEAPGLVACRRATGVAKACAALPYIDGIIDNGERPVLWCWHREVVQTLVGEAHDISWLHGGLSTAERAEQLRRFTTGETRALAATIACAGTGLDGLQHVTHRCVFVEESFVPADNEQAVARLHRTGQREPVLVSYIRASCMVDRVVQRACARKITNAEEALR